MAMTMGRSLVDCLRSGLVQEVLVVGLRLCHGSPGLNPAARAVMLCTSQLLSVHSLGPARAKSVPELRKTYRHGVAKNLSF